jgi:hypothetical protein
VTARARTLSQATWGLVVVLFAAVPALAHTRSQSFSSWRIREGRVEMTYSVTAREATRIPAGPSGRFDLGSRLVEHLRPRIVVRSRGERCPTRTGPRVLASQRGYLRVESEFNCPAQGSIEIEDSAFFGLAPSHVHFARVDAGSDRALEYLFTDHERTRTVSLGPESDGQREQPVGTAFLAYVRLGVQHILVGFDHLAFLAALLILIGRLRDVVLIVTGFTIGHSITLSLAVLGIARPDVPVIEALIGFTIALVAAENIGATTNSNRAIGGIAALALGALALLAAFSGIGPPAVTLAGLALFSICYLWLTDTARGALRLRPAVTVLFGLVHGFGFASVLMELGIPRGRLLAGLLGFNLGVEIGQLMMVTALYAFSVIALARIVRFDRRLAVDAASAGLCGLGLFWFVGRAYVL